ncbi:hypothetical protein VP01_3092g4 [Puccinia sorghi]|uniref:Retrovirus-related Pol polyprotein from transposon TNT 1-94-like beta-barrel domain-containing protein n=1 Tax=Puccinia sorghi TaxID=27349 RepID=A0A0L6V1E5_9BASI|nr:hypothetical protein VP01_3092g4 [Puccinia sorghi]
MLSERNTPKRPSATLTKLQEIVHLEESRKAKNQSTIISKSSDESAENASALIHESFKKGARKKKRGPYCKPGKHNPGATSHDKDHCYQLYPHLRPPRFSNQSEKAITQLVEVDNGHESEVSLLLVESENKPIVLDSGATHHMVNDPTCFTPIAETNVKISTGGHNNLLYATAIGKATLVNQEGKTVILDNVLLVPSLTRSLISIPRLFNKSFTIEKTSDDGVRVCVDKDFMLQGSLKHNLLELPSENKLARLARTSK